MLRTTMPPAEIIDSLKKQAEEKNWTAGGEVNSKDAYEANVLMEAARLLKEMETPNVPLTPEEMRKMAGELVWIQPVGRPTVSGYEEILGEYIPELNMQMAVYCGTLLYSTYGRLWLPYRRRPEICLEAVSKKRPLSDQNPNTPAEAGFLNFLKALPSYIQKKRGG